MGKWLGRLRPSGGEAPHDWDTAFERMKGGALPVAPVEVDWSDPDAIEAERRRMADGFLYVLATAFGQLDSAYADIPPQGRLAIVGAMLDAAGAFATFNAATLLAHDDIDPDRGMAALGVDGDGWREWLDDAADLDEAETEARECGCGRYHPFGLSDGSTCLIRIRESGTESKTESVLVPFWHDGKEASDGE